MSYGELPVSRETISQRKNPCTAIFLNLVLFVQENENEE